MRKQKKSMKLLKKIRNTFRSWKENNKGMEHAI
jgi:hypothetical protein